jgi:hypothetical protein
MSVVSRAVVFYGTWVKRRSKIGKSLSHIIEDYGGTPAPTNTPGVVLCVLGSAPTGDEQVAICLEETVVWYDPGRDATPPRQLMCPSCVATDKILECLRRYGIASPDAPVDWYFGTRDS